MSTVQDKLVAHDTPVHKCGGHSDTDLGSPTLGAVTEPETRAERKERTRQALLDGTLEMLADRGFAGLSLREVARSAGIVPTAFYRHFSSMEDLGVTLAEEGMRVLRRMLREARRDRGAAGTTTVRASLDILLREVRAHEGQFRFLGRERHGGTPAVRRAISTELRLFASELTIDLSRMPALASWPVEDLEMAADLIVAVMMTTVVDVLEVPAGSREERAVVDRTERQLRLVLVGMGSWRPNTAAG